jgi:hypothetical protein
MASFSRGQGEGIAKIQHISVGMIYEVGKIRG